jgi:hypothetical protein
MAVDILAYVASTASISGVSLRDVIKRKGNPSKLKSLSSDASRVRRILATLEEPSDQLVGYWELADWEMPPKTTSVSGRRISGGLAIYYRERQNKIWHGMMVHSLYCKRGFWDPDKPPKGEPPFIATYEVRFQKEDDYIIGSSVMTDKIYYSWISRLRAKWFLGPIHRYRGEFKECTITSDGRFQGNFEGIPSSGQVSFSFHMNKKWAIVEDALLT